ncbi:hypothetical protein KFE94_15505 [bacterium SCSIO 12643]|nr:hypothetical protein KFE94_15505 [bacterium SCSIO 12643]
MRLNLIILFVIITCSQLTYAQSQVEELVIQYSNQGSYSSDPVWKRYPTDTLLVCINYQSNSLYSAYLKLLEQIEKQPNKPDQHTRVIRSLDSDLEIRIHWDKAYTIYAYDSVEMRSFYSTRDSLGNLMCTNYSDDVIETISYYDNEGRIVDVTFYDCRGRLTFGKIEGRAACLMYKRWEDSLYTYESQYYYDTAYVLDKDYAIYTVKKLKNTDESLETVRNGQNKIVWSRGGFK